jgi:hypothetical protein
MNKELPAGEKIIVKLLNSLKQANEQYYNSLSDKKKMEYVKKELAKLGLYIDKTSKEMQSFQNLELLHNELNTSLQNLVTAIGHSNNQTKLFRLGYNVNTIIESYLKIDELLDKYKNNLRPFQSLISKYVKKIHVSTVAKSQKPKTPAKSHKSQKPKTPAKTRKSHI